MIVREILECVIEWCLSLVPHLRGRASWTCDDTVRISHAKVGQSTRTDVLKDTWRNMEDMFQMNMTIHVEDTETMTMQDIPNSK